MLNFCSSSKIIDRAYLVEPHIFDKLTQSLESPLRALHSLDFTLELAGTVSTTGRRFVSCELSGPFNAPFAALKSFDRNCCLLFPVDAHTNRTQISNVCVVKRPLDEAKAIVERALIDSDNNLTLDEIKSTCDLLAQCASVCTPPPKTTILFQAYSEDAVSGELRPICAPVTLEIALIDNGGGAVAGRPKPITILKSSKLYGSLEGNDLIIVLVNSLLSEAGDVDVEFFQLLDGTPTVQWIASAVNVKAHGTQALMFNTPSFRGAFNNIDQNSDSPTTSTAFHLVYFRIINRTTGDSSNSVAFYFSSRSELAMLGGGSLVCDTPPKAQAVSSSKDATSQTNYFNFDVDSASLQLKLNRIAERTANAMHELACTGSYDELVRVNRFLILEVDTNGNTALHSSVLHGHCDVLHTFVKTIETIPKTFDPAKLLSKKNRNGFTPLLIAAYLGSASACDILLSAGASLDDVDVFGNNAAHIACSKNFLAVLRVIIKHARIRSCTHMLNSLNNHGFAPIHAATLNTHAELVREIISNEDIVDVNVQDRTDGYTALHFMAMCASRSQMLLVLCDAKTLNINTQSYLGATALLVAVVNTNYLHVIYLVRDFILVL